MTDLYLVIKEGVYIQGIFGVYDTLDKAKEALKKAIKRESDNYHHFNIIHTKLNTETYIHNSIVFVSIINPPKRVIINKESGIKNLLRDLPIKDL